MNIKIKLLYILLSVNIILLITPFSIYSESLSFTGSPHGDKTKLPKGCRSCHKGHGVINTPMLPESKDVFCFRCHGDNLNIEKVKNEGKLAIQIKLSDLQREFEKTYHHPIEKTGIHRYDETFPEKDTSKQRHAECGDCHHHHFVQKNNKFSGVIGLTREGVMVESIKSEYELCFKCHSYSANLPADQINKAELFNVSNASFHPVVTQGKNNFVPSLISPLTASSIIKCTNCHNNDDPLGPKGPHGSNYRHILAKNFSVNDGAESSFEYELCYSCHRRTSILGNESFKHHNLHISTAGASCRTCHNPHGSNQNTHLIDIANSTSVSPSSSGRMEFADFGIRSGQCFLTCHGKNHNPAVYPSAASSTSKKSNR
jgi:predicted CXXCH cytochrome family protein